MVTGPNRKPNRSLDRADRADAEAAAWLARLESTGRTEATEAGLKAWLGADPAHENAFERAMDCWAIIPGAAALADAPAARPRAGGVAVRARSLVLAASLLLVCLISGWWLTHMPVGYSTRIGEQKVATLEDGTRIALNTDTALSVDYDEKARRIQLDNGEAMFEVAHNAKRPFIVTAGDKTVTAVGTSFIVRKTGESVVVTLIEGKVLVATRVAAPRSPSAGSPTMLAPGDRLTAAPSAPEMVAHTSTEAATAWRRGQVVFSDTPLSAAVAELNRYGGPQIGLSDPRLGALPVSGVFATNDTAEFASAVATLHGLHVEQDDGSLRIAR